MLVGIGEIFGDSGGCCGDDDDDGNYSDGIGGGVGSVNEIYVLGGNGSYGDDCNNDYVGGSGNYSGRSVNDINGNVIMVR